MSMLSLLIIFQNGNTQNDEQIKNEKNFNNKNLNTILSFDQRKKLAREYYVKGRDKYDKKDYLGSIKDLEFVVDSIPIPNGSSTHAKFYMALNYKQLGDMNKFCSIMRSIQNQDIAAANWVKSSCESGSKVTTSVKSKRPQKYIDYWKNKKK